MIRYALLNIFIIVVGVRCGEPYPQGKFIYEQYCENCHATDGTGLAKLIPPISQSDYYKNHQQELPCIIKNGMHQEISVNGILYDQPMQGSPLTAIEITNLINYMNTSWGNQLSINTLEQVKQQLTNCE